MNKLGYRKDHLLESLREKGELKVSDIAELYGISLPSVRRLCSLLEREKRAIRTHGGLRSIQVNNGPYKFDILDTEYAAEKAAIAQYAVNLIENRQSLFLESGTTVKQFAIALAQRLKNGELSDTVIFTNSMANFEVLQPVCKVILVGGLYRPKRRDFCGFLSEKIIRSLRFDVCLFGADGVDLENGIMAMDAETVHLDELLIKNSEKKILLSNSEKFSKNSLVPICSVKDVQLIITDSKLPKHIQDDYRAAGVNLECVDYTEPCLKQLIP